MDAHTHKLSSLGESVYVLSGKDLASVSPSQMFCAGIHPWGVDHYEGLKNLVVQKSLEPHCVGIGETGLDRLYPHFDLQLESLRWHWDLAEERSLPLILHLVKSSSDILALLKRRKPTTPWVWHDFQGPLDVVEKVLKFQPECFFSFGPRGLKRPHSSDLWNKVPASLRLIETDDSGMSVAEVLILSQSTHEEMSKNFHTAFSL